MIENIFNFLKFWLLILVVLVLMLSVVTYIQVKFNEAICDRLSHLNPQYNFNFNFFGGCYMEIEPGLWLPKNDVAYFLLNER